MRKICGNWNGLCKAGLVVAAICMCASCGDNKTFSEGNAEDAIEEMNMFQDSANVVQLQTGFYELNDAEVRYKLRQLAANEMITYKAEQINEVIPAGYWSPAKLVTHVFVTVGLTEKGQKYVVTEPVKDKDAKELENEVDKTKYPEAKVAEEEQVPVKNPNETLPVEEGSAESSSVSSGSSYSSSSSSSSSSSMKEQSLYKQTKQKESTETVQVLAFQVKVKKVKNLVCTEEMQKEGRATCDAVIEVDDATPFGRVLAGLYDGDKRSLDGIELTYYVDKGWQVVNK